VGRGNHPYVDMDCFGASETFELLFLHGRAATLAVVRD
jgi:hypothetical protein